MRNENSELSVRAVKNVESIHSGLIKWFWDFDIWPVNTAALCMIPALFDFGLKNAFQTFEIYSRRTHLVVFH